LRKQAGVVDALDENHGVSVPGTAGLAKVRRDMAKHGWSLPGLQKTRLNPKQET